MHICILPSQSSIHVLHSHRTRLLFAPLTVQPFIIPEHRRADWHVLSPDNGHSRSAPAFTILARVLTLSSLISCSGLCFGFTGTFSIASSVESTPSITLRRRPPRQHLAHKPVRLFETTHFPKIVYLPSREGCLPYVMKNYTPDATRQHFVAC